MTKSSNRNWIAIAAALGTAFTALEALEIAALGAENWLTDYVASSGNVMLGLAVLLIGAVFLTGAKAYRDGTDGGAFMMVACALGLFVGTVVLLTLVADAS
jgi:hypothetical protein